MAAIAAPLLLAYDVCTAQRLRRVHGVAARARLDGQKSAHETALAGMRLENTLAAMRFYLDEGHDRLLLIRLDGRQAAEQLGQAPAFADPNLLMVIA